MYITSREREIIHILLQYPKGITVLEIANKINLSQRTVHRELKHMTTILAKHEIYLEKKAGVGLLLQGTIEKQAELKKSLLRQISDFTAKEREELILLTLLKSIDTTKLVVLANDFNVTTGTISQHLDKISERLKLFGITLIRKKGHGISLKATEKQKRNALGYFLSMQFNEYEFFALLKDPAKNKNRFLDMINIKKLTLADQLIREMMAQYDLQLTDHAHMTLTIHLSIAMARIAQGKLITIDEDLLDELKKDEKFSISKEIATVIEDVFNMKIPDREVGYMTNHLKGARLNASVVKGGHTSIYATACRSLITYVSQKLDVPFEKDPAVFVGLLKHIEPAIYRLERGMDLYNPLTSKIMTQYPKFFEATRLGLKKCFSYLHFSDSETAYIVLYFGASNVLYDAKKEIRIGIICPSGLGSSKMLSARIQEEIDGVVVITSSLGNLKMPDLLDYDLVLSTVELNEYSGKYLLISPILNDLEIDRIQKEIKQYTRTTEDLLLQRVYQKNKQEAFQVDTKEIFHKLKTYSGFVLELLDTFAIYDLNKQENLGALMAKMLRVMYDNFRITDVFGVRIDLEKRQRFGGFGIPQTGVAVYHCRTEHVEKSVFDIFRLDVPVKMDAMDKTVVNITSILMVLAPVNATEIELDILSLISTSVIEDATAIRLFTSGSRGLIEQRLSQLFYQRLREVLIMH